MSKKTKNEDDQSRAKFPPSIIGKTPVVPNGEPIVMCGESWVTLVPEDSEDDRLWEFSVTTGRLILTRSS